MLSTLTQIGMTKEKNKLTVFFLQSLHFAISKRETSQCFFSPTTGIKSHYRIAEENNTNTIQNNLHCYNESKCWASFFFHNMWKENTQKCITFSLGRMGDVSK